MRYEFYILILSSKARSKFFILVSNTGQRWVYGTTALPLLLVCDVHLCILKFAVGTQQGIHNCPLAWAVDHRSFFILHTLAQISPSFLTSQSPATTFYSLFL